MRPADPPPQPGRRVQTLASSASTGRQLDVDSNSACDEDSNPTENVFWPVGSAPHGTYTFWVDLWSDCDQNGGTATPSFTLQVFEGNSVVRTINGVMPASGQTQHYTHTY